MITYFEAAHALVGGAMTGHPDGPVSEIIFSDGQTPPSDSAIKAKLAELQAEYNAQAYARSRATEYPSIQEQLDLQYWDKVNSTDKWVEAVKAVKDKYPKG